VQGALHARAVVGVKLADALGNVVNVGAGDFFYRKRDFALDKTRGGDTSEVNDDFQQFFAVVRFFHGVANIKGENVEQGFEVVCNSMLGHRVIG